MFMFRVEASWFGEGGHWKESLEISLKNYTGVGFKSTCGFSKIKDTILGLPLIRTVVCGGLYWGPLFCDTLDP